MNRAMLGVVTMVLVLAIAMPQASAFCNGDYTNRFPLTQTNDLRNPFNVNDTSGFDFGDGIQYFDCENASNYLCYADSTDYACFDDDTKMGTFIEEGNGTPYGSMPSDIVMYLDMGSLHCNATACLSIDSNAKTWTKAGANTPALNTSNNCKVGSCQYFKGSSTASMTLDDDTFWNNAYPNGQDFYHAGWYYLEAPSLGAPSNYNFIYARNGHFDFSISGARTMTTTYWYSATHRMTSTSTEGAIAYNTWSFVETMVKGDGSTGFIFVNGVDKTASASATANSKATTDSFKIGFSGGTVYYNGNIDTWIFMNRIPSTDERTAIYNNTLPVAEGYSEVGESETQDVVDITINTPISYTTYYTDNINLNFSIESVDDESFLVNASANGISFYYNESYINTTSTELSLEGLLTHGTQTITLFVNVSTGNTTATILPYIWHGINATVYNANGSLATCYNLLATNGTTNTSWSCQNDSVLLEWSDLPQGSVDITANATDFDNESYSFTVSNSMGFEEQDFTIYKIQNFYATTSGSPLGNLSMIELTTGNYWNHTEADTSKVEVSLRELSIGIQVYTFIVHGYGQINNTITITIASEENRTIEFTQSSLEINTYDERTFGALPFNVTITNGTVSYNSTGETNPFNEIWFNLPQGNIMMTISSDGYVPREYYSVVSPYSIINLNSYLLTTTEGIYITFYVISYQGTPIEDVILTAQKTIGAVLQTVEQETTDASGSATMYLDPYESYYIKVEADGYIALTFNLNPDPINPVVYIRLELTGGAGADYVNYSTMFDAISYQFLPTEYYHEGSLTATYELSSSMSDLEYQGWNVTYSNGSSVCSEMINDQPSGTTLSCVIPNTSGKYIVEPFFKRADYTEYKFNDYNYWVYNYAGIGGIVTDDAISNMGYWLIAILITLIISGFASRFLGGYATGWLAIGIFAMFVTINPTIAVAEVSGWLIVGIMTIAMISITILRSYI